MVDAGISDEILGEKGVGRFAANTADADLSSAAGGQGDDEPKWYTLTDRRRFARRAVSKVP